MDGSKESWLATARNILSRTSAHAFNNAIAGRRPVLTAMSACLVLWVSNHDARAETTKPFATTVLLFDIASGLSAQSEVFRVLPLLPDTTSSGSVARHFLIFSDNLRFLEMRRRPVEWRTGQGRVNVVVQPSDGKKGKLTVEIADPDTVFCNWEASVRGYKHPTDHPVALGVSIENESRLAIIYDLPTRFLGTQRSQATFEFAVVGVHKTARAEALANKECIPAWTGAIPIKLE